jgi:hypothetical protein
LLKLKSLISKLDTKSDIEQRAKDLGITLEQLEVPQLH